jgi:hypothetical protein
MIELETPVVVPLADRVKEATGGELGSGICQTISSTATPEPSDDVNSESFTHSPAQSAPTSDTVTLESLSLIEVPKSTTAESMQEALELNPPPSSTEGITIVVTAAKTELIARTNDAIKVKILLTLGFNGILSQSEFQQNFSGLCAQI